MVFWRKNFLHKLPALFQTSQRWWFGPANRNLPCNFSVKMEVTKLYRKVPWHSMQAVSSAFCSTCICTVRAQNRGWINRTRNMVRKKFALVIRKQGALIAKGKCWNMIYGIQKLFSGTVNTEICEIWGLYSGFAADQKLLGCDAFFSGISYLNMDFDSCCGLMIGKANHNRSCKNMAPLRMWTLARSVWTHCSTELGCKGAGGGWFLDNLI